LRYFSELVYNGKNYFGWQRQPNQISVQETIENAFSTILNCPISITGCGRTDTGVHASQYFIHFDYDSVFPRSFINRLNKFLPEDISIRKIFEVADEAHARYDAFHRSYAYHIDFNKNPFELGTIYHFHFAPQLDLKKMQAAAQLLLEYEDFFPFCKTNSDVKSMKCELRRAEWVFDANKERLVFHIAANRFLRGMVRLIVGMCLNIGLEKISIAELKSAMENQTRLQKSWSVPPDGLFLTEIKYPFIK